MFGGLLGALLVVMWFSLIHSPFAPQAWDVTVAEQPHQSTMARIGTTIRANSRIAKYAFGIPLVLGAVAGAVTCVFVPVCDVRTFRVRK